MKIDFTPRKSLRLQFPNHIYMRDKTHSYLWLHDLTLPRGVVGRFLTMDSGAIEIVSLEKIDGTYQVEESGQRSWDLAPAMWGYSFVAAVRKYWESTVERSEEAEVTMCDILGVELGSRPTTYRTTTTAPKKRTFTVDAPAGKKARAPKAAKAPKAAAGYSLTELCQELKLDPAEARKQLRGVIEKPGGKWEWPTKEAAAEARKVLEAV